MSTLVLSHAHKDQDRLNALAGVYQGMDRILTGGRVTVEVTEDYAITAPAWSTGDHIVFNSARIDAVDVENIARLHGLNVHELAHVLYSPRKGTTFMASIIDEGLSQTSNLLEDQRIETLLTAVYPSTRPWLQATLGRWILDADESEISKAYVLVRGRKYLPGSLRRAVRAVWSHPHLLPDIDRIIDRYRVLAFPSDYEEGLELTRQLHVLLAESGFGESTLPSPFGHGDRPVEVLTKGRPRPNSDQRQARDRAEDGEPEEDDSDVAVPSLGGEDGEPDADLDGEQAVPAEPSDASGSDGASSWQDVLDEAADLVDEVMSDREVRREIHRTQRQVSGRGAGDELDEAKKVTEHAPAPEFRSLSKQFRNVLQRLMRQAEPGWQSRQSSGKINVLRWAQEKDVESAFDRWDDGIHDAMDLEVVILLDESGSMQNRIHRATDAMWATKRALDAVDASTTVLCFSNDSRTLYKSSEKATGNARFVFDAGGTDPVDALRQAAEIFHYTQRSQKILIVFTDGVWFSSTDAFSFTSEDYINRMNRGGVTTSLGYVVDEYAPTRQFDDHGCKVSGIVDASSLVPFVQNIVTTSIRQRLSRR